MGTPIKLILKEIGSRINNIGTIVDTDPNNDNVTSNSNETSNDIGAASLANIIKGLKNTGDTSSADVASAAASDKSIKDISSTNTADIIENAYKGLDDIIYRYNEKGQALGNDDKLRAGITAQSLQGSILESVVIEDPETGYKMIDTRHLALANAAAIKEIFERLDKLEGK